MLLHYFSTLSEIARCSRLFSQEATYLYQARLISNISYSIFQRTLLHTRGMSFLLLRTLLRYSDIITLSIQQLKESTNFFVVQQKTKRLVCIKFPIHTPELISYLSELSDIPATCTYNQLQKDLKRCKQKVIPNMLSGHNNGTHIFRHIEASYLAFKGEKETSISKRLGHLDNSSLKSYIHNELFSYFI